MYLTMSHQLSLPGKHIISTNGTLQKEALLVARLDNSISFRISLYGLAPFHDNVTGVKGSFEKSYSTVSKLKAMGIDVGITSPFWNTEQLMEVIDNANELEVDVRITALVPNTETIMGNTCSTGNGKCNMKNKLLILPNGEIIHCASEKRGFCKFSSKQTDIKEEFNRKYGNIYKEMEKRLCQP